MNDQSDIVKTLVDNFTQYILTRMISLVVLSVVGFTYDILPNWTFAVLVFLISIHLVELKIVNLYFQAYFEKDNKFDMMLKVLDYLTLSLSAIFVMLIALIAVL